MRNAAYSFAFALVLIPGITNCAQGQNTPAQSALAQKLKEAIPTTKFSGDKSTVVTPGAVVALQKDNLLMYTVTVGVPPRSTYEKGKLKQTFSDSMVVDMADGLGRPGGAASIPRKTLVTGEKFWVSDIAIDKTDIIIRVVTDPYDDGRYFADLKFPIAKGSTPSPEDALKSIGEVLTVQPAEEQAQAPVQPPPPPPAVAPPPLVPPPPPTDATPVAPPSVSLGQTMNQVTAILGQPKSVAHVGTKTKFIYPDVTVIFTGSKVTDVQ